MWRKPDLPVAYVLLNTEIGAQSDVMRALRKTEGVQEAFHLMGIYDIIARVNAESMDKLTKIVNDKLRIDRVHSKLTVVVTEAYTRSTNETEPALVMV